MAKRRPKHFKYRPLSRFLGSKGEFVLAPWTRNSSAFSNKTKIVILSITVSFCLGILVSYVFQPRLLTLHNNNIALSSQHVQACFTPGQACFPLIQKALETAKQTIHLQAYTFTQKKLTESLIEAAKRGVNVIVILDKSQRTAPYSQYHALKASSIPVYFDTKPAIAHNKIIIIDSKILITGSYNFSQAAETKNAENLLIINSPELSALYEANFQKRLKECDTKPLLPRR